MEQDDGLKQPTRRDWGGYWSMIVQQTQNAFNDKAAHFLLIPLGVWLLREASRVEHIRAVLDTVQFDRAVLVGHSLGGDEITAFAGTYPERVAALVYLDSGVDHTATMAVSRNMAPLIGPAPQPEPPDLTSALTYQRFLARVQGVEFPIGEVLATYPSPLREQRLGHVVGRSRDQDALERRLTGPAVVTVTVTNTDVLDPERPESLPALLNQCVDSLDTEDMAREFREHRSLITATGANLEHLRHRQRLILD